MPSSLVVMDSFPLTVNGKLDKKALPDPTFVSGDNYVAPTTDLEQELCSIWEALLGIDRVGVTDNFFRIGGDSILSIQLSSRIRQSGYVCQVKDIFESKTVANLAVLISAKSSVLVIDSEQGILEGSLGFLPVQQWFLDQVGVGNISKPGHWNQSFLIRVPELAIVELSSVIERLVSYHDGTGVKGNS